MNSPERILVRGVNWLGDAVMTTPALLRLREAFPSASISLLAPEKLADLWRFHPAVDRCISFAARESAWSVGRRLRQEKFSLALVLPNSFRSALEAFLARAPRRIGYGGNGRSLLLTEVAPQRPGAVKMRKLSDEEVRRRIAGKVREPLAVPPEAHHIHQYLHLVRMLGANPAPLAPRLEAAQVEIAAALEKFAVPAGLPLLGLNAGAEYGPAKRWPEERFADAAISIQRETGCHWLIFGGKADLALAERIAARIQAAQGEEKRRAVTVAAGRTSLRELCALLKSCRFLLTNDTGPMHVAAALGTRVIVPFGSTSPELTGPGLPGAAEHSLISSTAPCSPCFLRECPIDFRCMRGIAVERVVAEVLRAGK